MKYNILLGLMFQVKHHETDLTVKASTHLKAFLKGKALMKKTEFDKSDPKVAY